MRGCSAMHSKLPTTIAPRSDVIRKNGELLDRTFLSLLVGGNIEEAVKFAERVVQADKTDRVARLVLGVNALKRKRTRKRAATFRNRCAARSRI